MPILILDEGTSAIDKQTAYEIENQLLDIPELTLITITHNLNQDLRSKYHEIITMDEGSIDKNRHHEQAFVDTAPRDVIQFKYAESLQI